MSNGIVKAAALGAIGKLSSVLLRPRTSIGYIIPQVYISSEHSDELVITDHPIETGAPVSDHAYKNPAMVRMSVGWGAGGSFYDFSGTTNTADDAYPALLDLQNLREPFALTTSLRTYPSMLITNLSVTRNADTNSVIIAEVEMREVVIVDTQATTLPPRANQSLPAQTAAPVAGGAKQVTPPKTSALLDTVRAFGVNL